MTPEEINTSIIVKIYDVLVKLKTFLNYANSPALLIR
jgi:hypothetical protein